ncbi:hypothetical protein RISK_001422 [Rhodopirellula islandica]|uniref:Transmembrane protein n=1 Tax=Rhodopirellula islandica TaxID=595434 RepID=A0A0J1BJH0_RHOIS|nr:hypothetical protein [Rhodopirellula islandica]KLU06667.1 hypothetical protein RISK_001422 [Rhodopirellula islandica]
MKLSKAVRLWLAGAAACLALLVSVYALWKPATTAGDLVFLPHAWVVWLDDRGDFRTFVMAGLVAAVPAGWLGTRELDRVRVTGLLVILLALLGMEVGQRWIPTRGFGTADLLYTLAGVAFVEAAIRLVRWTVGAWTERRARCDSLRR